jgi:hypothetical protein
MLRNLDTIYYIARSSKNFSTKINFIENIFLVYRGESESRGLLLGKVFVHELLQSRASRPVLAPFISSISVRVLQDIRLGSNVML